MKHPKISLLESEWFRMVALALASRDREIYGPLIGRRVVRTHSVEHALLSPYITSREGNIYAAEEDEVLFANILSELFPKCVSLGSWHSHPWDEDDLDSMLPQISETDKGTAKKGEVQIICTITPKLGVYRNKADGADDFDLYKTADEWICRAEGWLKDKHGRTRPCQLRLR
jgi:hypothetical protein